jgi:hypothetical protein
MAPINENPNLPSQDDLAWALTKVLDGVKEHDLSASTGLSDDDCARVFRIYEQVYKANYPNYWLPQSAIPTRQ